METTVMIQPAISIIIPVYNAEKFIGECIQSVMNQTFSEWELVIINDGSTDNSEQICQNYINQDRRIKLYNQVNQGVNQARKNGFVNSVGQYICFLDADDYLPQTALDYLYKQATSRNLDIAMGAIQIEKTVTNNNIEGIFTSTEYINALLMEKCENSLHGKIISRKSFTNDTFCLPQQICHHEDLFLNIMTGINVAKVGIYNELCYCYRYNINSLSNSKTNIPIEHWESIFEILRIQLIKHNQFKDCEKSYRFYVFKTIYHQISLKGKRTSFPIQNNIKPKKPFEHFVYIINYNEKLRDLWCSIKKQQRSIIQFLVEIKHFLASK